jgi:putative phosphoesterase
MKIGVISDIHGNFLALQAVTSDMLSRGVDQVFNLGDNISGPLWPKETIHFLMEQHWKQIAGNHEKQLLQDPNEMGLSDRYAWEQVTASELGWLKGLPRELSIEIEGKKVHLCHGIPGNEDLYLLESVANGITHLSRPEEVAGRLRGVNADLILCGHSHTQRAIQAGNTLIVNPGSAGLPAYSHDFPGPHTVESGSPHARYAVIEYLETGWHIDLIAVPYEHDLAADQARKNGRLDWESGLRIGYII